MLGYLAPNGTERLTFNRAPAAEVWQRRNLTTQLGQRRRTTIRPGRPLFAIADSLAFTIEQMEKIDEAYKVAFPDRG